MAAVENAEARKLHELQRLIEKVEGPLPVRAEQGEEIWRLELTRDERNTLADALYIALNHGT